MKLLFTVFTICGLFSSAFAQESKEKIMEKRAREMHRVICLTDQDEWIAFVKGNYTQALIDKPIRAETDTNDNGQSSNSSKTINNVDAKAGMFQRVNSDFGKSKIVSLKQIESSVEMIVKSEGGMSGTFVLIFEANQPYLIDGLRMEVIAGD